MMKWLENLKGRLNLSSFNAAKNYINTRAPREKVMGLLLTGLFVGALDNFLLIMPINAMFQRALPELSALHNQHDALAQDQKNKSLIRKEWENTKKALEKNEAGIIDPNEAPRLLENLSKLAVDSGVRIVSIQASEALEASKGERGSYRRIPLRLSALAGTHDMGKFLARMESGQPFFRVAKMKIRANAAEPRRHFVELTIDAFGKS